MSNNIQLDQQKKIIFTQYFKNQLIGLTIDGQKIKEVGKYPADDKKALAD